MDRVILDGIRAVGRHGVSAQERATPQEFEVAISCEIDAAAAARTDDIRDTLDYRRLREIAVSVIEGPPCRLVETLATRIADAVLERLGRRWVRVRVTKLRPAGLGLPAAIEVERGDASRVSSAPVELHVPDFAPAKRFYGALGFAVLREEAEGSDGYLVMGNGTEVLRFWPGTAAAHEHGPFAGRSEAERPGHRVEIVLTFDDLDAAYARARDVGTIREPLRMRHWGLRDFRVEDPYGFYVRCTERHDPITGRRAPR